MNGRPTLFGRSLAELEALLTEAGAEPFRARQLFGWLYRQRAEQIEQMQNLPGPLRDWLAEQTVMGIAQPRQVTASHDGTRKYLFPTLHGGFVEAAYIPEATRATLCLSTQVGCRRGCTFCQTARQGFQGNLSSGEILNQYRSLPEQAVVTNIVYMGMGEPLDNIEAVLASLAIFTAKDGFALSPRRITVSTVGIRGALEQFLDRSRANLAVSLHSPFPAERRRIMPVENANPIEETVALLRHRREDRLRKVSFEYTLFAGLNDTPRHVAGIARLLNGLSIRVNLIRYHQIEGTTLQPSTDEQLLSFERGLRAKGIRAFIRASRGQDIQAACGMLWTRHVPTTR